MEYNENEEIFNNDEEEDKENNIDIIGIVNQNNKNIISIKKSDILIPINSKSIYKILSFILDNKKESNETMSDIYIDHITINIISPNDIPISVNTSNENMQIENYNSQPEDTCINILNEAKLFYINFKVDNNIGINKRSLKKIFKFLNQTLIDNLDYINLVILFLKNENQNDLFKYAIEQKILKKYSGENAKEYFGGIKRYNSNLKAPSKNKSQNIYEIDNYFNKILDYIDDYDKESSFSEKINNLAIPRKTLDEDLIRVVNVSFIEEEIITADDNNKNEDGNDNKKNLKYKKNPSFTNSNNNICNNNVCKELCYIF